MSAAVVLVVDDADDIREMTAMFLEEAGFITHTAANGAEALAALMAGLAPDVIVLDYHMPHLSGPDVLERLGGHPTLAAIPVILATGSPFEILPKGVTRLMHKPFTLETLLSHVGALCHAAKHGASTRA